MRSLYKNSKIIIFSGKAQSGKDTSAEVVKSYLESNYKNCNIRHYSFASELKEICYRLFNINRELLYGDNENKNALTHIRWCDLPLPSEEVGKLLMFLSHKENKFKYSHDYLSVREFLQILGTNILRKIDKDCWVNSVILNINSDNPEYALITDARFPNELLGLNSEKTFTFKFLRNPINSNHESETALDDFNWSKINKTVFIDNENLSLAEKNNLVINHVSKLCL